MPPRPGGILPGAPPYVGCLGASPTAPLWPVARRRSWPPAYTHAHRCIRIHAHIYNIEWLVTLFVIFYIPIKRYSSGSSCDIIVVVVSDMCCIALLHRYAEYHVPSRVRMLSPYRCDRLAAGAPKESERT